MYMVLGLCSCLMSWRTRRQKQSVAAVTVSSKDAVSGEDGILLVGDKNKDFKVLSFSSVARVFFEVIC